MSDFRRRMMHRGHTTGGSRRDAPRLAEPLAFLAVVAALWALAGASRLAAGDPATPPVEGAQTQAALPHSHTLALLVGSGAYHGDAALQPLEYTDNDVVRFARYVSRFVAPRDLVLLMTPDKEAAQAARALGLDVWRPATRATVLNAMQAFALEIDAYKRNDPRADVRVTLFISAHGDELGVHMDDGVLSGAALQASIERMHADQVVVIADSCFSDYWLGLKGEGPTDVDASPPSVEFPLDAVANAVRDLERVGAVTSQSFAREERTLIQGGLITHVVSSALLGGADIDQDGRILYPELAAYLEVYSEHTRVADRVRVHAPRAAPERPPMMVDLTRFPQQGLELLPGSGSGVECFWVRTEQGALAAELCKRLRDTRRLWLPSGRYQVQRRSPPEQRWGREGMLEVVDRMVPVHADDLPDYWISSVFKGEDPAPVQSARPLTPEETGYLTTTPYNVVVTWRTLSGRLQPAVHLGARAPLTGLNETAARQPGEVSLTEETHMETAAIVLDWRALRLGRGYGIAGVEAAVGLSPGNAVGAYEGIIVLELGAGLRLGYERPFGDWAARFAGILGAARADPFVPGKPVGTGSEADDAALSDYTLPFLGRFAIEVGATYQVAPGWQLEVGFRPHITLEPQLLDASGEPVWVPYLGLGLFAGARW